MFEIEPLTLLCGIAYLHMAILLFVISQAGGLYKASATYEAFLFFLAIDLSAYFGLSVSQPWAYWFIILPGVTRAWVVFCSPHARRLVIDCPTHILIWMFATTVPIGLAWLIQVSVSCPNPRYLYGFTLSSALWAFFLFLFEKDKKNRLIFLFMVQSPLCVQVILASNNTHIKLIGSSLTLLAVSNLCVSLHFMNKFWIRFFTIPTAILTLLISAAYL